MENNGIIRSRAYARAGFVGNPSDGYNGKTISFTFDDFYAETVMYEAPYIELLPNRRDRSIYNSLDDLEQSVRECGYYGGIRLLQASLKRFREYCRKRGVDLGSKGFAMRYFSNIPHHVGMAGSSAIITACFRGLARFYDVDIPRPELANIILSVETDELGIGAGLQDRVAQVYQGLTYMDFNKAKMAQTGYGDYVPLDPSLLPNIYIAFKRELSEGSEVFHNDIRARFNLGERKVVEAMQTWAGLADQVRAALLEGRKNDVGELLNANFDLRRRIYAIHPDNIRMVEAARSTGASAKFTGSGGAIVGTYADDAMFAELKQTLEPLSIAVLKPNII
ncbi:mevalonate kinase [Pontiella sp.]|uniref:mevalonate kinase family protein n=1 Tax=Pontiella sp. TaxID=2837462 RepID=UPI00356558E3